MIAAVFIRAVALLAQFAALYVIIEFFDKAGATAFFAQVAVSLLVSRAATLAMPLYAYPLIERRNGSIAIAMALQVQIVTFPLVIAVLIPLYGHWELPVWSGIVLYIAALLDMNHVFFRHILVANKANALRIVFYEASQPVFFGSSLILGYLLCGADLAVIVAAYVFAMCAMMVAGAVSSGGAHHWREAMRQVARRDRRHLQRLFLHARKALPVSVDQFVQMGVGNFPVYAATAFGKPLDVITMALLQRLIAVVEAFSWLDVVHTLDVYYVKKAPELRLAVTLSIAAAVAALAYAATWLGQIPIVEYVGNSLMPNFYFHLVRLAEIPCIFLVPSFAFLLMHLHSAYLGSQKFMPLLVVGLSALIGLALAYAAALSLIPDSILKVQSLTLAIYGTLFIALTAIVFPRALGLAQRARDGAHLASRRQPCRPR